MKTIRNLLIYPLFFFASTSTSLAMNQKQLITAIRNNDTEKVQECIKTKIELNYDDSCGASPLSAAVDCNRPDLVTLLLEKGANVNRPNRFQCTPLMWAAIKGYEPILLQLLNAKAEVNFYDRHGYNALMCAAKWNKPGCIRILIDAGSSLRPSLFILLDNNETAAELLIQQMLRLNATQKKEIYTLLCCPKKNTALFNKDIQKVIALYLCEAHEQDNKINLKNIFHEYAKYHAEEYGKNKNYHQEKLAFLKKCIPDFIE